MAVPPERMEPMEPMEPLPSVDVRAEEPGQERAVQLFALVHGICGSSSDWSVWEDRLALCGREDFLVRAASSITEGSSFGGWDLQRLGDLLAGEVLGWILGLLGRGRDVVLHFVCHSMGGLIMRAALPRVCEELQGEARVAYGHVLTLNTPHLGVHGAKGLMMWKNLSALIPAVLFKQIHQLTLQDGSDDCGRPDRGGLCFGGRGRRQPLSRPRLLDELARPDGQACRCLAMFAHRTAVAATHWDVVVPFCTAAICAENPFRAPSLLAGDIVPFWRVDAAAGFPEGTTLGACHTRGGDAAWVFADLCASERPSAARSGRGWCYSSDGEVAFPAAMLDGLCAAAPWRRIAYTCHQPWWGHADVHVFAIGKDRKVKQWSVDFIDTLISIFLDDPIGPEGSDPERAGPACTAVG
uniref:DUF676 domain-containing protein n=1 Tax=Zooxanthella nutricula TaxID=1333877 RepID=A0A7S2HFZ1_9DINO